MKDEKLYEAIKMLDKPVTEVKNKVVECIDTFMEENGIQTESAEIL